MDLIEEVLSLYFERTDYCVVTPISTGLINSTYRISLGIHQFILQEINTSVFQAPEVIISNMLAVAQFLEAKDYPKAILRIRPNRNGFYLTFSNGKVWRMTEFVPNSKDYLKVVSKEQAYHAAKAISEFHYHLNDFPIERISPSINGFLDFEKRINSYQLALANGNKNRITETNELIESINRQLYLIEDYLKINFPLRVVHADAKISNFLFDETNENNVLAIIDWDTILPGNMLCDFGDMVRTYANLKAEDDASEGIIFSSENYKAVKEGFLYYLKNILADEELNAIDLTAQTVILIQAIRFLTDYLNDDVYYATNYVTHNLDRTINQMNLLTALNQYLCTS